MLTLHGTSSAALLPKRLQSQKQEHRELQQQQQHSSWLLILNSNENFMHIVPPGVYAVGMAVMSVTGNDVMIDHSMVLKAGFLQ